MTIKEWLTLEKEDLNKRIKNYSKYRFLVLFSAIVGFAISLVLLWQKTYSPKMLVYDQAIINFIEGLKTPFVLQFFTVISSLGSSLFIVVAFLILSLVLVVKRRKRAAVVSLISLIGGAVFIYFLKHFFGRPRPSSCFGNDCFSFPSGHTTMAVYFYGLLDYLMFRFLPVKFKTFLVITFVLISLVFLVALSRLFLNLHFLSDIFAGVFLGGAWLMIAILLIDFLY